MTAESFTMVSIVFVVFVVFVVVVVVVVFIVVGGDVGTKIVSQLSR